MQCTEREREKKKEEEEEKKPLSSVSLKLRASEWLIGHTVHGIDMFS